jgi:hypothetical protein
MEIAGVWTLLSEEGRDSGIGAEICTSNAEVSG